MFKPLINFRVYSDVENAILVSFYKIDSYPLKLICKWIFFSTQKVFVVGGGCQAVVDSFNPKIQKATWSSECVP